MNISSIEHLASQADARFVEERYLFAIDGYTSALASIDGEQDEEGDQIQSSFDDKRMLNAIKSDILARRAAAYLQLANYTKAYEDAKEAVNISPKNLHGLYRLGLTNYHLKKYEDSFSAFKSLLEVEPEENRRLVAENWCQRATAKLQEIKAKKSNRPGQQQELVRKEYSKTTDDKENKGENKENNMSKYNPMAPQEMVKTRHEWLQNDSYVSLIVYAKNVDSNASEIRFTRRTLSVCLKRPSCPDFIMELDLWNSILPCESTTEISPFKVEIKMKKEHEMVRWESLEKTDTLPNLTNLSTVPSDPAADSVEQRRQKNWDKIVNDELEDFDDQDGLQKMFQQIYSSGDESIRRAMNKSFVESGGTVLSTNWADVSKKKVEYKGD